MHKYLARHGMAVARCGRLRNGSLGQLRERNASLNNDHKDMYVSARERSCGANLVDLRNRAGHHMAAARGEQRIKSHAS